MHKSVLSAFAADTNPPSYTLSYYNYVKLHALSSPVRVLATNYATANKSRIYEPLIPGELSYVKFALDYNGNVDINVYTQDGTLVGPVYGARYAGHVTGKPSTGYESKNMSEYQIQQTLRTLGKGGTNFRALTNYAGIGLTGEPAAYRTLAQYYEYHGLENPFEAAPSPTPETTEAPQETSVPTPTAPAEATETPEPTPEATEIPAATEEPAPESEPTEEPVEPAPSEEPSAPVSSAQPEETTAPETESAPDESAPVSESAPIAEAAAMNTAITEPVAAMALTTEAEPQEATSAEQEPTSEPVATEAPAASEEPVATPEPSDAPEATAAPSEEPVSTPVPTEEPAETAVPSEEPTASPEPSEEPAAEDETLSETEKPSFTHEELQEIFQLTDEEVANFTDVDWDEFASLAADTYSYDKRGNRTAETGKKASQSFVYDATNRMVEGTNWKGDKSAYTYNGLGLRVNNLVTTHAGKTYDRDYVIDYTSPENDDLYVYAMGNGQLEYEQRHVYAGSERLEQITEKGKGGWERTLYVHEDVMGNTRYYTKATGQNFAELQYDAWGQPDSPNKLVNNDHGNYVFATFTGHIYDPVLDIYFAEARFYDAINRTWMAMDPAKDGLNWYQYAFSNPTTYWDPTGMFGLDFFSDLVGSGSAIGGFINSVNNKVDSFNKWMSDFAEDPGRTMGNWWEKNKTTVAKVAVGIGGIALTVGLTALTGGAGMLLIGAGVGAFTSGLNSYIDQTANGGAVDWGTLARDTLQGGVIGGISGGVGGAVAQGVSGAFGQFCGRSASNVVAQVAEKWAVGTVADGVTGMATTFVANMFDTEGNVAESLQRTGDSMAQIWGNASITSFVSVAAEAAVTPKCFVAGTAVVTSVGLVAIEHIKPGDMVLAENEETGEIAYKEVVQTFTNISNEITHVTVTTEDGQTETIDATPHHPFYVEGKGWVDACALHAGMVVWLADGTKAIVTDVVTEGLEHPVTVYNFEVTDFHTYFVGESGVLVHNLNCGGGTTKPTPPNPNGRKGSPEHQAVVDEIADSLSTAQPEVPFQTEYYVPKDPDVHSTVGSRYADLAELDANENPIVFHQVGRTTKGQQPVARERRAIADLLDRTGVPVVFHSYNDPNYKPTVFTKNT